MKEAEILAKPEIKEYFRKITKQVDERYWIAKTARKKGLDLSTEIESVPAADLAERIETLVGPEGVAERYRQLFKELKGDRMKIIFRLAKEIVEGNLGDLEGEEARIEKAVKVGLLVETEGVVVAPVDGVPKVTVSKNPDGSRYVDVYYAGPIRAAGGSSTVIPLILADYARNLLGLDRYKPTEEEVERYVEEISIYQNEVISRQYMVSENEIRTIIRGCPVCINGVPTVEREVSVYRDMERVPSNRIRGGMGLVVSEGVALKAMVILEWAKLLGLNWSWLEKIIKVKKTTEKKVEIKPNPKYLERIAAGRPLLAYPMRYGGFRLRYGRSRNSAIMGKAINPATMSLLNDFIAVGTHIRIERPGKAAQLFPCTSINGPIVKLKDGEVLRVNSVEEAEKVRPHVQELLFLGDMLVSLGDFRKTAHPLMPSPYVKEWWEQEAKEKGVKTGEKIDGKKAVELSEKFGVPLHPRYLHYYTALKTNELKELVKWVKEGKKVEENREVKAVEFEENPALKEMLENIGLPHKLREGKIVVEKEFAYSFLKTFGALEGGEAKDEPVPSKIRHTETAGKQDSLPGETGNVLEVLSRLSGIEIRDKAGTFIGARMGRPEAARERTMKGNPHVLFPIGLSGGPRRSINKALDAEQEKKIKVDIALFECPQCGSPSPFVFCPKCGKKTVKIFNCTKCGRKVQEEKCPVCGGKGKHNEEKEIDLEGIIKGALEKLNTKMPELVKGVKGLINAGKEPEPVEKGILRAKHDLYVFRDGTMRYELLNAPITHFKPKEIGLSVEKVKELGYSKDKDGKELASEEQVLEIFPQDIIVHEGAGEWMVRVSKFLDELLERFYGGKAFYNAEKKEDLIGELVVGLAPHTSAGIIGRIIGYSKAKVGWGHPYFIMTKRRNCVHPSTGLVVWDEEKKKTEIKRIGELVEKEISENPKRLINADMHGTKIIENHRNLFAYRINPENNRLEKSKITHFFKGRAPGHWIKITTNKEKKFVMDPNHRFIYLKEGKIKAKNAKEALAGDLVPVALKIPGKNGLRQKKDYVPEKVVSVKKMYDKKPRYCLEIDSRPEIESKVILWGNKLLQARCDGDQDSIMLLLDPLLNFSEHYLSASRGGRMDAPLVLTSVLNPLEIDKEVYEMEAIERYPPEFYRKTLEFAPPAVEMVEVVKDKLGKEGQYTGLNYTHETDSFDLGPKQSTYVKLATMEEKIRAQAVLQSKIRALDKKDALERVMLSHFIPDIIGNTRAYSRQTFRCSACNTKFRRIPLVGKCTKCGGNIILTIAEGSVKKYLAIARQITNEYNLSHYLKQRIDLIEKELDSVFENGKEQRKLHEFV